VELKSIADQEKDQVTVTTATNADDANAAKGPNNATPDDNTAAANVPKETFVSGAFILHTPEPRADLPNYELDIMVLRNQKAESSKIASRTRHHGPGHHGKIKEPSGLRDKLDHVDGNPGDNSSPLVRFFREGDPKDQGEEEMFGISQPVDKNWLTNPQMLKAAIPTARIMEPAYTQVGSKTQNIPKVAVDLLEALSIHRASCPKRPIMFIAHRTGGGILQRAFVLDRAAEELLRPRFEEHKFLFHSFAVISQGEQLSSPTQEPPIAATSPVNDGSLQQAKRTSLETVSRTPAQALAVQPVRKPEILNVVIGIVFLETVVKSKDDRALHTRFMDIISELGIPARW
jgi:hypothetical protein